QSIPAIPALTSSVIVAKSGTSARIFYLFGILFAFSREGIVAGKTIVSDRMEVFCNAGIAIDRTTPPGLPHGPSIPVHVQNLHVARGVTEHERDQPPLVSVDLNIHRDLESEAAHGAISRQLTRNCRGQSDQRPNLGRIVIRRVVFSS